MATIVVDANVLVQAAIDEAGLGPLEGHELIAPPVMPSEALSSLHEMQYRGEISRELAKLAVDRLSGFAYEVKTPPALFEQAWRIADQLGWAKTYDAEYVALARLLDCSIATFDARLMRGAAALATIISPDSLEHQQNEEPSSLRRP